MRTLTALIAIALSLFMVSEVGSQSQLFFENFETGNLNNWVNTALWAIATDQKDTGTYSAKCTGANNCDMQLATPVDTSTAQEVNLTLRFRDDDLDGAGDAPVYFNDSTGNWDIIGELDAPPAQEDTWLAFSFASTDSQYFHKGFNIRFETTLDGGGGAENLWIDNVNVSYTPTSACYTFAIGYPAGQTFATFETTDTAGASNQTQVNATGQTLTIPFYTYDNQCASGTQTWSMKLDSNLNTSKFRHKVSQNYNGWQAGCSGVTTTGCANVETTSDVTINNSISNIGISDAKAWTWADHIDVYPSDTTNKTLTSTSS